MSTVLLILAVWVGLAAALTGAIVATGWIVRRQLVAHARKMEMRRREEAEIRRELMNLARVLGKRASVEDG